MSGTPDPSNPPASADKPTKRTGPKGDFGGHRYTFLQDHLEEYYGKVQSVTTHHWWPVIYSEFWARFDWRSHANILLNQPIDEDSFSADAIISHGDDDLLSEIEADMKAKTMKAVNSKIKNWFTNRRSKRIPKSAKAFSPLIKALVKPSGSVPRKPSIAQYFMSHEDYADEVERALAHEVALNSVPLNLQIDLRCKIAQRIFDKKPAAVRQRLEAENDTQYQAELAAHKEELTRSKAIVKGMPSHDPEDQDRALTNIETSVQPLLDDFERMTGHKWALMGIKHPLPGQMEFGFSYLQSTHPTVKVKTWSNHEPAKFKRQVLAHLVEYMTAIGPSTPSQPPSSPLTRSQLGGFNAVASSSTAPPTPSSLRSPLCTPSTTPIAGSSAPSPTSITSNVGSAPLAQIPRPRPRPSPVLPTPDPSSPALSSSTLPLPALELVPRMPLPSLFDSYPSLSRALNTLPSEDRELAIVNVTHMPKERREQEESKLRSEYILSQLSPQQYQSLFAGFDSEDLFPPPTPLSQPNLDAGHLPSPRQARIASNATSSKTPSSPSRTPAKEDDCIPAFEVDETRSPLWMQSWMGIFSGLSYASISWTQLLQNWQKLEHDYGYISPPRGFNERLDIFKALSKARFDTSFTCDAPSSIANDFRSWWVSLNSPTRTCADNGWPIPGTGDGAIEIDNLRVPGKNGWLSVLFALMIWRNKIGDGDTTEWNLAVADVSWVTLRLIAAIWYTPALEDIPTLKRSLTAAGADEEEGRGKRSRARAINYRV